MSLRDRERPLCTTPRSCGRFDTETTINLFSARLVDLVTAFLPSFTESLVDSPGLNFPTGAFENIINIMIIMALLEILLSECSYC